MQRRPIASGLIFVLLALVAAGCGRTRQIEPAVPQSGPLIGTWVYTGEDFHDAEGGIVRRFVIGDGPWFIPATLTFSGDGTAANPGYHPCHFWIEGPGSVKLSVGNGTTVIPYTVNDDTLTLTLRGTNDAVEGTPAVTFIRVKRGGASDPIPHEID